MKLFLFLVFGRQKERERERERDFEIAGGIRSESTKTIQFRRAGKKKTNTPHVVLFFFYEHIFLL
jgi:hypothetical protein